LGRASETDAWADGADAAGDEKIRAVAGVVAVDVDSAKIDIARCVTDERHPALAAVGVAGKLECDGTMGAQVIEVVRFEDEGFEQATGGSGGEQAERFAAVDERLEKVHTQDQGWRCEDPMKAE
jgi:hypothetical protein